MLKHISKYLLLLCGILLSVPSFAAPGKNLVVKEQVVKEVIKRFILSAGENTGMEINVKRIGFNGQLTIPAGSVTYEVVTPAQWPGYGKTNVGLLVRVDERVEKNISIPVEVEARAEMLVALRPLERGEVLTSGDVSMQKREVSNGLGKICRNPADAVGKKVKIPIRGNSPIRVDYLEKVPLVRSGQVVTIIAETDILRVTAAGKVKSSGAAGDLVVVQNLASNKDVPAKVIDSNTVRVEF